MTEESRYQFVFYFVTFEMEEDIEEYVDCFYDDLVHFDCCASTAFCN